jgi:hypothetical protein
MNGGKSQATGYDIIKNILLQRVGNVFNWSIKNVQVLDQQLLIIGS